MTKLLIFLSAFALGFSAHAQTSEEAADTAADDSYVSPRLAAPEAPAAEEAEEEGVVASPREQNASVPQAPRAPAAQEVSPRPMAPPPAPPVAQAPGAAPAAPATAARMAVVPSVPAEAGGEVRAPSPKAISSDRRGYFQLGAGPAYGAAMKSDSTMYNFIGSYNANVGEQWVAKAIVDLYMGTGSVSSSFRTLSAGVEWYSPDLVIGSSGAPYIQADAGIGFARNAIEETAQGLAVGGGAGFKFQAAELNLDINAHYEQLTVNVGSAAPAIFALRGSVTF